MDIIQLKLGNIRSNCYIVIKEGLCFIVDPGFESDLVYEKIDILNLKPIFIYLTHGHYDHIGGANALKARYHIPIYAPIKDKIWLFDSEYNHWKTAVLVDHYVSDGDKILFDNTALTVIETPGHSAGGTMLLYNRVLFGGDTLFFESVGRTDLPFSSFDELRTSILKLYALFPDDTIIYPGHGRSTTIGHEKTSNPFVHAKRP